MDGEIEAVHRRLEDFIILLRDFMLEMREWRKEHERQEQNRMQKTIEANRVLWVTIVVFILGSGANVLVALL